MLKENYRREMDRVSLPEDRIEEMIAAMGQKEETPVKTVRKTWKTALAVAAACAALVVSVFAASPTLRQTLADALGGFGPYAQSLEGAVEGDGFRLQVRSALTDANNAIVYAELTDLEGDRLAQADVNGQLDLPVEGEVASAFSCSVVSYDPETRTALLRFSKDGMLIIPDGAEGEITLYSIQPGDHNFASEPIPVDHIPDAYLDTMTLSTGKTVLRPEQNPLDLPGKPGQEGVHLSSAGFASDGRLHYLVRFPEETASEGCIALVTTFFQEGTDAVPRGKDSRSVAFSYEGSVYFDHSIKSSLSDRDDLKELSGAYGGYVTAERVKFAEPLHLPVKLSVVDAVTSPLSGFIYQNTLQELRLSALSVTIFSTSPDNTMIAGYPLSVTLSDGTSLCPEPGKYGHQADSPNMARWIFETPVEVDDITAVTIGDWVIPVENGVAGEGYWRPAQAD